MSPSLALVAVGPGPEASEQAGTRLMAGTVSGHVFREIGPRVPANYFPDSVFFLDHEHGWFTVYDEGGGPEILYRTENGGVTWRSFAAPTHVVEADTTDQLDFITPTTGWLARTEPTGPGETLFKTSDGGATWLPIATSFDPDTLPGLGFVRFQHDGSRGWLGNLPLEFPGAALDRTTDGGRTWQHTALASASWSFAPPEIFGTTLVDTATGCLGAATRVRVYLSHDDGETWSLSGTQSLGVNRASCGQATSSFPSPTTGWAATLDHGAVRVYRTIDSGRGWSGIATPYFHTSFAPTIAATDALHAWLLVPGLDINNTRIYTTDNGGLSWNRIDQDARS